MFMMIGSFCSFTLLVSILAFKFGRNTVKWEIEEKEAQKTLEESKVIDPIVEHLLVGLSSGLWKKVRGSEDSQPAWEHLNTKHLFTIYKTRNNFESYQPMIYNWKKGESLQVVHNFSSSELKLVKKAIKDRELEKLADANIGSELN